MRNDRLRIGTPCLIRGSRGIKAHDGKLVVVRGYTRHGYECEPELADPADGAMLAWVRRSLIPLGNARGTDEMLRITGKPTTAEESANAH